MQVCLVRVFRCGGGGKWSSGTGYSVRYHAVPPLPRPQLAFRAEVYALLGEFRAAMEDYRAQDAVGQFSHFTSRQGM